jgi:hypothetical protein
VTQKNPVESVQTWVVLEKIVQKLAYFAGEKEVRSSHV